MPQSLYKLNGQRFWVPRTCLSQTVSGHALRKRAPHVAQFATTKILETEPHPEPLATRIEKEASADSELRVGYAFELLY